MTRDEEKARELVARMHGKPMPERIAMLTAALTEARAAGHGDGAALCDEVAGAFAGCADGAGASVKAGARECAARIRLLLGDRS